MTVKDVSNGQTMEVNHSYGARLIEHGKVIPCPAVKPSSKKSAKKAVTNGAD